MKSPSHGASWKRNGWLQILFKLFCKEMSLKNDDNDGGESRWRSNERARFQNDSWRILINLRVDPFPMSDYECTQCLWLSVLPLS